MPVIPPVLGLFESLVATFKARLVFDDAIAREWRIHSPKGPVTHPLMEKSKVTRQEEASGLLGKVCTQYSRIAQSFG